MPNTYPGACVLGCMSRTKKGLRKYHRSGTECPLDTAYNAPNVDPATGKEGSKPPADPTEPSSPNASSKGTATFSDRKADVTKMGERAKEKVDEVVDYIVDAPHTLAACGLGFGVLRTGSHLLDDYMGTKDHIPDKTLSGRSRWDVSPVGKISIANEPRNWYSRAVTFVTKRAGAKNQAAAHGMIDAASFAEGFAGLGVALFVHHKKAWKESPKRKEAEAKKAAAIAAKKRKVEDEAEEKK